MDEELEQLIEEEEGAADDEGVDLGLPSSYVASMGGEEVEYLTELPSVVPAGRVLVHNHVRPTRRLGARGFRAWLAAPGPRWEVCGCGLAPELGEHYRAVGR